MLPPTLKPTRTEHNILLSHFYDKVKGAITQDELSAICYKWTIEYAWDEFKWQPLPTPPEAVSKWREMSNKIKKALEEPIRKYYTDLCLGFHNYWLSIDDANRTKLLWLYEMKEYFTKTEDTRLAKVMDKISAYELHGTTVKRRRVR